MPPVATESRSEEGLRRGLSRWNALAIVVGGVVGTGIYIRPAVIAQLLEAPTLIMLTWLAAGLFSLAGALSYAELAARIPSSGGEYAFLRVTIGELGGFLYGWMRMTVGAAVLAAQAVALAVFVSDIVPMGNAWERIVIPALAQRTVIEFGPRQLLALLTISALAVLNIRGVGQAGRFQTWVTAIKVVGLLALILAVVTMSHAHASPLIELRSSVTDAPPISSYSVALLAALTAFNGWSMAAMVGGEVQDSARNVPWALVRGIGLVIGLYLAANFAYLHVLSMPEIISAHSAAHPDATSVASRAATAALGAKVGVALPLLFAVSALGALHVGLLTVPRAFFAMARDGLLPKGIGRVKSSTRTPAVAITIYALIGAVLAVLGGFDRLANMAGFGYLVFYALNTIGLLRLRHQSRRLPGHVPARLPIWVPVLFLAATLCLLITLVAQGSVEIVAAATLIAIGAPVFAITKLWKRGWSYGKNHRYR